MKQIIIGLDPGTIQTGFAVIGLKGMQFHFIEMGVLSAPASLGLEKRLCVIGKGLEDLYRRYSAQEVAIETSIEKVFFGKNPDSAFKLGHVFGLCYYQAGLSGSLIFSYATRFIKQSVTGSGRAAKSFVRTFVLNTLNITSHKEVALDATDALATAICHAYQKQSPVLTKSLFSNQQDVVEGKK